MGSVRLPLRVSVPGKLMLAGEYAVLQPGGLALALAVRRQLQVEVETAARAELSSALLGFDRRPTAGQPPTGDRFVDAALAAARAVLAEQGIAERPLHLVVRSTLDDPGQPKAGLGSSAALTVAVIGALLAAHGLAPFAHAGRTLLLGLALTAHLRAQGWCGSGYDVAAVLQGGVTAFSARTPLAGRAGALAAGGGPAIARAVTLAGEARTERLALPAGLRLAHVSCGRAAATPALVAAARGVDASPLQQAALAVHDALAGGRPAAALLAALAQAQRTFEAWDAGHGLGLMTPELRALAAQASAAGLVPRVSGAGGGDSLLVLGAGDAAQAALAALAGRWWARGHALLPVEVAAVGAALDDDG